MANELLTRDEYRDLLSSEYTAMAWSPSAIFARELGQPFGIYKGKRIIFRDDGMVVLFEAREWCGSKDTLDKYNNCSKCGGYPTAKRTQQSVQRTGGDSPRPKHYLISKLVALVGFFSPRPPAR